MSIDMSDNVQSIHVGVNQYISLSWIFKKSLNRWCYVPRWFFCVQTNLTSCGLCASGGWSTLEWIFVCKWGTPFQSCLDFLHQCRSAGAPAGISAAWTPFGSIGTPPCRLDPWWCAALLGGVPEPVVLWSSCRTCCKATSGSHPCGSSHAFLARAVS